MQAGSIARFSGASQLPDMMLPVKHRSRCYVLETSIVRLPLPQIKAEHSQFRHIVLASRRSALGNRFHGSGRTSCSWRIKRPVFPPGQTFWTIVEICCEMRSFLVALLIVIFSGVHTAAAIGVAQMDASVIAHSAATDHDQVKSADKAHSHHMKCCEKASDTDTGSKMSGCGADCVSFVVSSTEVLFTSSVSTEHSRTPSLFAVLSLPQDQPPKRV